MKHLTQDKDYNCGQTCVSMITGRDIRFIELLVGSDEGLNIETIISICEWLDIKIKGKWVLRKSMLRKWICKYLLPLTCFVYVSFKNEEIGHLIVRKKGKFFDPNGTEYYLMPKRYRVKAYLKIK